MTLKHQQEGLWICGAFSYLAAWFMQLGSTRTRQCENECFTQPGEGEWAKANSSVKTHFVLEKVSA